ncbi:indole-3-glycerol phosphate synthase TrpC [Alkalicoccobacillus porphyridii]|uniref:Indole-3-glycerol phosphate synthase n=1 Tax=Alkalicoccobacillus porphyridii TaxID=2597270 RepID=A0A553ZZP5_9BACI|nr:indole-3-glycerol phosphate synthase TrpC [Alkalicoccobacillus porphyridii]TSB46919.1 indole-3-glycerol phosphate synthase TrpC [Alkalicoccobacillus porphyridii]
MLETILKTKRKEISELILPEEMEVERHSLYQSLIRPQRTVGLIAEVKKASPSKGLIREQFNPVEIATEYEKAGADAISVLTDEHYFQGHREYLSAIKQSTKLPIMRKDFIIDEIQIEESFRIGADALLLIAGTVSDEKLYELYQSAYRRGLECLVEVHEREELEGLLNVFTPQIIGINNRNLKTFQTDLGQTENIAELVPKESIFISESGIHLPEDIERVKSAGAQAVLVGESLMRAASPTHGIATLFGETNHETTS